MNHSMQVFPVHHQLPESTQIHVHWVSDAIQPSYPLSSIPFSSCHQSFPASGSFPKSQLFASCGQSIGVSASTSVLLKNTQDWSPLGWTGWISSQFKGLSRVFSNTTVQKHQFFGTQLSSQSNSHIHTWLLEKPQPWPDSILVVAKQNLSVLLLCIFLTTKDVENFFMRLLDICVFSLEKSFKFFCPFINWVISLFN